MHYKNGREAKEGDHVITKSYNGTIVTGVLFNTNPGAETCNGSVSVIKPGGSYDLTCQTVGNMYHAEDGFKALEAIQETLAAIQKLPSPIPPSPAA